MDAAGEHRAALPVRRWRMRRALKWAGTSALIVIAISAVVTLRWCQVFLFLGPLMLQLRGGALGCCWVYSQWPSFDPGMHMTDFSSHEQRSMMWRLYAFAPHVETDESFFYVEVPLWIPLVIAGIPTAFLWRLDRRRIAPGACRCGYDLTGNTSGRCPECGTSCGA